MSRAGLLQTRCLELMFIRPENLVSEGPLGAFSKCVSCVLTEERIEFGHTARAVTVEDFYHRGGIGPTTAGGAASALI